MQFIDRAEIEVEAGKGGDGMVAFRREKYVPAGGPAGGNGGRGGSVILVAVENLQTLLDFRYAHHFKAEDGGRGGPNNCTGAAGKDLIIEVPCGTAVYDGQTGELLDDLIHSGQTFCVASGGKGGLGNKHFLSNRNRAPEYALPGLPGEQRILRLELKLLAEVGIIGLPNAGKSTLIAALSAARPKVADYPFTTLVPNLGVVRKPSGDGIVAFRREKYVPAGGPAGGNGGRGGSVILVAVENLQTLLDFRYAHHFKAEDGGRGGPNNCTGAAGKDLIIEVPCGTAVYDAQTGELLDDLIHSGQTFCVASGGKGGLGNKSSRSSPV